MPADNALAAYGLTGATLDPLDGGLINKSWRVATKGERFVLQSLNKIFAPVVHEDIEAVTAHLAAKHMLTPRLVRTQSGALWNEHNGEVYRLFTFIDGETIHRLDSPKRAAGAGALVGRFHTATLDCEHAFLFTRPGAHDTAKHMQHLRDALAAHATHPRYNEIAKLAQDILGAFKDLAPLPDLPLRLAHGDLKVSNILFEQDAGKALVDLDTLARLPLAIELGDALRSWCNPAAEDTTETTFDLTLARAALRGYFAVATFATEQERRSIAQGTLTISLELAARFCADALEERYFGWDPARFGSRSEHNLVRGVGQFNVFKSLHAQSAEVVAVCLAP